MSLIVEDGTIVTGAESYCTVAFADDYHAKRGNTAWDALDTTDEKEPALRKATDYMVQSYNSRWKGVKVDASTQALDWPREEAIVDGEEVDGSVIPEAVKRACAELALKAATASGAEQKWRMQRHWSLRIINEDLNSRKICSITIRRR